MSRNIYVCTEPALPRLPRMLSLSHTQHAYITYVVPWLVAFPWHVPSAAVPSRGLHCVVEATAWIKTGHGVPAQPLWVSARPLIVGTRMRVTEAMANEELFHIS